MGSGALFVAVLLACIVEAVEAATIVLAVGTTRDWRSSMTGVGAGVVLLACVVGALGPALTVVPISGLRVVVGGLLLVFGLQWLRKSILRASGWQAVHDEDLIFTRRVEEARAAGTSPRRGVPDWYAFTVSFKGVVLEGLEVAFIVLTFGSNEHEIPLATVAAATAIVLVAAAAVAVRAPLARVPENTLKLVVGVMLTSFGTFWGAEGVGAGWPGSDAALLVLTPLYLLVALSGIAAMRRARERRPVPA